jgi:hypothetical protein
MPASETPNRPPQEAPSPTDPKLGTTPAEAPQPADLEPEPASPEVPQIEDPDADPFDEGNFPV